MLKFKNIIIFLFIVILSGCAVEHNHIRKWESFVDANSPTNVDHLELILKYNLDKPDQSLFDKNFYRYLNSEESFFYRLNYLKINDKLFEKNAKVKASRLYKILSSLEQNLHFLDGYGKSVLNQAKKTYSKKNDVFAVVDNQPSHTTKVSYMSNLNMLDDLASKIPLMVPMNQAVITSHYGYRKHPFTKKRKAHTGTDLTSEMDRRIYAAADGKVIYAGYHKGYGNMVVLQHEYGFQTRYAHLKDIFVRKGSLVPAGMKIGREGQTGIATSPHLHYEVTLNNKLLNPYTFLKPVMGESE